MFSIRRQPPPPPEKMWIQKPAWVSIVVTIVVILVLGPIGVIYQGLTEEMKGVKNEGQKHEGAIVQNQIAIKEILTRQQMILQMPKNLKIERVQPVQPKPKIHLSPGEFNTYMGMDDQRRAAYKRYLEGVGKDVRGLP